MSARASGGSDKFVSCGCLPAAGEFLLLLFSPLRLTNKLKAHSRIYLLQSLARAQLILNSD